MKKIELTKDQKERFLSKVTKTDSCWNWSASLNSRGYGLFSIGYIYYLAHRVSYTIFNKDPEDKFVCHKCDNPRCVNPDHLFLGTHQDNMDDMFQKKRGKKQIVVPEEAIKELGTMTDRDLAKKYNIASTSIIQKKRTSLGIKSYAEQNGLAGNFL